MDTTTDHGPEFIENKTYDEIRVGDTASLQRTLTERDIQLFAVMSGDGIGVEVMDAALAVLDAAGPHRLTAIEMEVEENVGQTAVYRVSLREDAP